MTCLGRGEQEVIYRRRITPCRHVGGVLNAHKEQVNIEKSYNCYAKVISRFCISVDVFQHATVCKHKHSLRLYFLFNMKFVHEVHTYDKEK